MAINLSHFQALLLFAVVISMAFAVLTKKATADRVRYAIWALLSFLAVGIGIGWLLYMFPR